MYFFRYKLSNTKCSRIKNSRIIYIYYNIIITRFSIINFIFRKRKKKSIREESFFQVQKIWLSKVCKYSINSVYHKKFVIIFYDTWMKRIIKFLMKNLYYNILQTRRMIKINSESKITLYIILVKSLLPIIVMKECRNCKCIVIYLRV